MQLNFHPEIKHLKLGAHYTTLYEQLLSCSYSQLKTYDWLAHTIQLFYTTRAQRHNSSTSQSLSSLIGAIVW